MSKRLKATSRVRDWLALALHCAFAGVEAKDLTSLWVTHLYVYACLYYSNRSVFHANAKIDVNISYM